MPPSAKDPDSGSFRTKCQRWGVVYIYVDGTVAAPADGGTTTNPPTGGTTPPA